MKFARVMNMMKWAVPGAMMFQMTGCDVTGILTIVQTVFLGVTAAGAVAILQNI